MKKVLKISLIALGTIILLALIIPLFIPIPPLQGVVPPEQLADEDSKFVEINNLKIHYKLAGQNRPAFVLLHGFLASTFTWRELIDDLATQGTVIAFDRPGFGLTERPLEWQEANPYSYDSQVGLTIGLMDALEISEGVLVGNSAGGAIAMLTTLRHPDRVSALILIDPAVYIEAAAPAWIKPLLGLPQIDRIGPYLLRGVQNWGIEFGKSAWYDPSKITPQISEGYMLPLKAENWDRGFWEFFLASKALNLETNLSKIKIPVLVITGENDRIVPAEQSIHLSKELPNAQLVVIPQCGHIPQEECPDAVLKAMNDFLVANNLIQTLSTMSK